MLIHTHVRFVVLNIEVLIAVAPFKLNDLEESVFFRLVFFPDSIKDVEVFIISKDFSSDTMENSTFLELTHHQRVLTA